MGGVGPDTRQRGFQSTMETMQNDAPKSLSPHWIRRVVGAVFGVMALAGAGRVALNQYNRSSLEPINPKCSVPIVLRNETRAFLGDEMTWYASEIIFRSDNRLRKIEGDGSVYTAEGGLEYGLGDAAGDILPGEHCPDLTEAAKSAAWRPAGHMGHRDVERLFESFVRSNLLALRWKKVEKGDRGGFCVAITNARGQRRTAEVPSFRVFSDDCEPLARGIRIFVEHRLF